MLAFIDSALRHRRWLRLLLTLALLLQLGGLAEAQLLGGLLGGKPASGLNLGLGNLGLGNGLGLTAGGGNGVTVNLGNGAVSVGAGPGSGINIGVGGLVSTGVNAGGANVAVGSSSVSLGASGLGTSGLGTSGLGVSGLASAAALGSGGVSAALTAVPNGSASGSLSDPGINAPSATLALAHPAASGTPDLRIASAVGERHLPLPLNLAPLPPGSKIREVSIPGLPHAAIVARATKLAGTPFVAHAGVPQEIVSQCREAVARSSLQYPIERVDAASEGPVRHVQGMLVAPIRFRMIYDHADGYEVRDAVVSCKLNKGGAVVALAQ